MKRIAKLLLVATPALLIPSAVLAAGSAEEEISPIGEGMIDLYFETDGAESSCGAYEAAAELGMLSGEYTNVVMMQEMITSHLIVQMEDIFTEEFGETMRTTDGARDVFRAHLDAC